MDVDVDVDVDGVDECVRARLAGDGDIDPDFAHPTPSICACMTPLTHDTHNTQNALHRHGQKIARACVELVG